MADHVGLGGDYDGNDAWPEGLVKLASGNVLRVMKQAEEVARRISSSKVPLTGSGNG